MTAEAAVQVHSRSKPILDDLLGLSEHILAGIE